MLFVDDPLAGRALAENALAVRRFHEVSGERRCERPLRSAQRDQSIFGLLITYRTLREGGRFP